MKTIDLSIIIPVYNAEKYIVECLDSIFINIPENFYIEVICIDDGSTDESKKVLYEYKKKQDISIYSQTNSGASAARNYGISIAKGDWITFIDADDKFTNHAMIDFKNSFDDRFQVFYYKMVDYEIDHSPEENNIDKKNVVDISEKRELIAADVINKTRNTKTNISEAGQHQSKVFFREFMIKHQIMFNSKSRQSEGYHFNLKALKYATKIASVDSTVYLYRQVKKSVSRKFSPIRSEMAKICLNDVAEDIQDFDGELGLLRENYNYLILWELINVIARDFFDAENPNSYNQRKKAVIEFISDPLFNDIFKKCSINKFGKKLAIVGFLVKNQFWYLLNFLSKSQAILKNILKNK